MRTSDKIRQQIAENPIILYMKGTPEDPQCGFSQKASGILNASTIPFAFVDVLAHPAFREALPSVSEWPTFPQLFINGELVGGCDIVEELHNSGELKLMLENANKTSTSEG